MNIREILDLAKVKNGLTSDNKLAKAIGTSQPTIFRFRQGFSYPSEENMIKLGDLAGLSRAEALILLNMWKAEGDAKNVYTEILRQFSTVALCFLVLTPVIYGNSTNSSTDSLHYRNDTVYYGKFKRFFRFLMLNLKNA